MAKEAEANADEDKKKRAAIDARNQLDSAVYQAEKMKSDYKDKLSEDDIKKLDEGVEVAKKVVQDEAADQETIEAAGKALNDVLMPIGAKMYESADATSDDSEKSEEADKADDKSKDETVEGEVVDEEDKGDKGEDKKD
jgi:molecular chaperone DnaK